MSKVRIGTIITCLNIFGAGIISASPVETKASTPVVYLSFEQDIVKDSKIIKDSSGKNYPGRFVNVGKNTKRVQGKQGFAVYCGGSDKEARGKCGGVYIRKTGIDFTKAFTATMLVKLDKKTKRKSNEIFGNTVSDRGPGFRFRVFWGSLRFDSGDGKKIWGCSSNRSKVVLKREVWLHLAIVFDGGKGSIFLNGEKIAEEDMTITKGMSGISLGSYRSGYAYPMNGAIDEFKIYDYAKTDLEISTEYLNQI